MSIEIEKEEITKALLNRRAAQLISLELAWRYWLPWLDLPENSRLKFCNWLNAAPFDTVVAEIERASTLDVDDPAFEIWKRLRRLDPRNSSANVVRRTHDAARVKTWRQPEATA